MMNYEVKEVRGENPFETKYGKMISYHITVVDNEGLEVECYTNRKEESAAPIIGERIFGQVDTDKMGNLKLTKMQDPNQAQGGYQRPANAPKSNQNPISDNPDRDMQIIRQSSLKVATDIAIANAGEAEVTPAEVVGMAESFAEWAYTGKFPTPTKKDVPAEDIPF